ncbi:MAG: glycoside hydrolase family 31 protein [Bacteroidales bacterium]|nr:glycoside hydrolase family 31 protein [Bacteroidales bacterium]
MKTWLTGAFLCVTMLATAHEMKTPPSRVAENQVEKQATGGDLVVAPLEGEFWWGGMTALGSKMPYASDTRLWNLERQNENNQIVPLLLSSKGRYIYSERPFRYQFRNDTLFVHSNFEPLKVTQAGKTLRDAYLDASSKYFPPTGTVPEEIFFSKPQYNTWIELMYNQNQADIEDYAKHVLENGFPTGIFMIDDNWQRYYGNYDFRREKFDDPKGMIDRLHRDGFKLMLWICPYVSGDSQEARFMASKGYLVKEKGKNKPAMLEWWNGWSVCVDLTNPEAFAYMKQQLVNTQQRYGVDGFKFDAGDVMYMCGDNLEFYDKSADAATFSQKWAELGLSFPYNEYRASFKMGGQPLVQRLGDKRYSWEAVSMLIPDMIAAGLLGHAYTCPDMIGGGMWSDFKDIDSDKFDQELIVRSCQTHAFMPMMQFSVAPWRILDKKHLDICRKYARFHEEMGTYLLETAKQSSQTGEPMVRHMAYMFPGQGFETCKDQFMIGEKYLVAPMVSKGYTRTVKLPVGKWRDEEGKVYKGGRTVTIQVPIERLPYFERLK